MRASLADVNASRDWVGWEMFFCSEVGSEICGCLGALGWLDAYR